MSFETNVPQVISYEYDFAVDGGAISTITLQPSAINKIAAGLNIVKAVLNIKTVVASATGAAVIGDDDDDDGYFVDIVAATAGPKSSASALGGAYLRLSASDIESKIIKRVLANKPVTLKITTGAVTAGKFKLDFFCYKA